MLNKMLTPRLAIAFAALMAAAAPSYAQSACEYLATTHFPEMWKGTGSTDDAANFSCAAT